MRHEHIYLPVVGQNLDGCSITVNKAQSWGSGRGGGFRGPCCDGGVEATEVVAAVKVDTMEAVVMAVNGNQGFLTKIALCLVDAHGQVLKYV